MIELITKLFIEQPPATLGLSNKLHANTLHTFLTMWPYQLRDTNTFEGRSIIITKFAVKLVTTQS